MNQYEYFGPVMHFDMCIQKRWHGTTYAVSESKARNNLTFRCKKELDRAPNSRISLPGKIILVSGRGN